MSRKRQNVACGDVVWELLLFSVLARSTAKVENKKK